MYDSDTVLLFAGGVGITFVLPHFVRIALHSKKTTCKLVWMVRDLGELCTADLKRLRANAPSSDACAIIEEQLQFVAEQLSQSQQSNLRRAPLLIEIHVTASHSTPGTAGSADPEARPLLRLSADQPEGEANEQEQKGNWDQGTSGDGKDGPGLSSPWFDVTIKHGRACMIVEQHFPTSELSAEQSLTIMSCGPAALCDEARMQAKLAAAEGSWKIIDYVEECYSW